MERRVPGYAEYYRLREAAVVRICPFRAGRRYTIDIPALEEARAVVEWDEGNACFDTLDADRPLNRVSYWKEAKIIGNIYENPSLLSKPE
jgi:hypothetical protein